MPRPKFKALEGRGKGIYDGCRTIGGMIRRLEEHAAYFKRLVEQGAYLRWPVKNDYIDIAIPLPKKG